MHRFLVKNLESKEKIILENKYLVFQIYKVLRFSKWESLILFNWKDNLDCIYEIIEIEKDRIFLNLIEAKEKDSELDFNLNLYQSIPNKTSKMEYILQKATEVWFKKIIFFKSERSQKLNISENKLERFEKIVIEATEQSNRNVTPKIDFIDSLSKEVILWENLFLHTQKDNEALSLKNLELNYDKDINIFIWPEWGFSDEEIKIFNDMDFKKVYLWNRIFRTETAWIVVWFFISQNQ